MEHINFLWLSPPAFNGMMCSLFQLFLLLKTKLLCSVWGSYSCLKVKSSRCRLYVHRNEIFFWYSRLRILQYISDLFIQLSLPAIHINEHCCYSRLHILQCISDLFIQLSLPGYTYKRKIVVILGCIYYKSDLFIQLSLPAIHGNEKLLIF